MNKQCSQRSGRLLDLSCFWRIASVNQLSCQNRLPWPTGIRYTLLVCWRRQCYEHLSSHQNVTVAKFTSRQQPRQQITCFAAIRLTRSELISVLTISAPRELILSLPSCLLSELQWHCLLQPSGGCHPIFVHV